MLAREELARWIEASGRRQVEIAETVGVTKVRLHRLLSGDGGLDAGRLEALERLSGITGLAVRLAAEGPRPRQRRAAPVKAAKAAKAKRSASPMPPAPSPPPEAPPAVEPEFAPLFDPELPTRLAEVAGCPDAAPLFKAMVELAFTARAENVRRAAAADLLDRLIGKAVQKVLDVTPKPPAVNAELLLVLEQLAGGKAPENEAEAPAPVEAPRA